MSDVKTKEDSKSGSGEESTDGASSESSPNRSPSDLDPIMKPSSEDNLIPVPPPTPKSGVSILAHKIWIGNLDKRLTE